MYYQINIQANFLNVYNSVHIVLGVGPASSTGMEQIVIATV